MAKRAKDRKISITDRTFYKLGLQDGEQRLRERLLLLQKTNRLLWNGLCELDEREPVTGVLLSYKTIDKIIRALKKSTVRCKLIKRIETARKNAQKTDSNIIMSIIFRSLEQ